MSFRGRHMGYKFNLNLNDIYGKFMNKLELVASKMPFISNPLVTVSYYLKDRQWVGILYLEIVNLDALKEKAGKNTIESMLNQVQIECKNAIQKIFSKYLLIKVCPWGDNVCTFITSNNSPPSVGEFRKLAYDFRNEVHNNMREFLARSTDVEGIVLLEQLNFHVGYSIAEPHNRVKNTDIYRALKESFLIAKSKYNLDELKALELLKKLIEEKNFNIVYQPLVNLSTGKVIGYEALTRGSKGSILESPAKLFPLAEKANLLYALEKVTREKALEKIGQLTKGELLFLNINPSILNDPSFSAGRTKEILLKNGKLPQNVVFEITERTAVTNFAAFRKALEHYRKQGFKIAMDDVGAGYSSLQSVAELKPDFIKIDRSLIANINTDSTKQALLETFMTFSRKINSTVIAEGIENEDELEVVTKLGLSIAQGFYIARPSAPFPDLSDSFKSIFQKKLLKREYKHFETNILPTAKEIVTPTPPVSINEQVKKVVSIFHEDKYLTAVVVVDPDAGNKPVGLITRDKLFYKLGEQYGFDLYYQREVKLLMDNQPLIVKANMDIDIVSRIAMERDPEKVYDPIIVVDHEDDKRYLGIISVQKLLDTVSKLKLKLARESNPLTGLPGNIVIESELMKRVKKNILYAALYLDLDSFKEFNDRYGFERGDIAIKMTGRIISDTVSKFGNKDDLVGHIGGDDFIVITTPQKAETISHEIIKSFAQTVTSLYDEEDRARGYISTVDREGRKVKIPIMSVSIAGIIANTDESNEFKDLDELAQAAAALKKKAKKIKGNSCVFNNSDNVNMCPA
ncbi:EAL and GGDEF domain-containing protein [Peptococcaceae bacterium]|nr:EAL and GGDEF domain-containing protein [Peptococcaceae bacterium]